MSLRCVMDSALWLAYSRRGSWAWLTWGALLEATAGPEQIHRTEHYIKVCLSLGGFSWKDAGDLPL